MLVVRGNAQTTAGIRPVKIDEAYMDQLVFSISEACAAVRTGRTALYQAIRTGELRAVKRGRRTLVLADDLKRYIAGLPPIGRTA